jgi:anti-sigma B factor antagonist
MSGNYSVKFDIIDSIPVIYVIGDMTSDADSDIVAAFNEILLEIKSSGIVFNFSQTNYINSAGLATLINIIQEMEKRSGKVVFTGLTSHFQKVMDIVGITEFVQIADSDDDARLLLK